MRTPSSPLYPFSKRGICIPTLDLITPTPDITLDSQSKWQTLAAPLNTTALVPNRQIAPNLAYSLSKIKCIIMPKPTLGPSPLLTSAPAPAPSPTDNPSVLIDDKEAISCYICNVNCDTQHMLDTHLDGAKHRRRVRIHEELRRLLQPPNGKLIIHTKLGWKFTLCPTIATEETNKVVQHIKSTKHCRALSDCVLSDWLIIPAYVAGQCNGNITANNTAAPARTTPNNLQRI